MDNGPLYPFHFMSTTRRAQPGRSLRGENTIAFTHTLRRAQPGWSLKEHLQHHEESPTGQITHVLLHYVFRDKESPTGQITFPSHFIICTHISHTLIDMSIYPNSSLNTDTIRAYLLRSFPFSSSHLHNTFINPIGTQSGATVINPLLQFILPSCSQFTNLYIPVIHISHIVMCYSN